MAVIERKATVVWEGDGPTGQGVINGASGALSDLVVTAPSRFDKSDGKTSPEELIASAHASCYGMALSFGLTGAGTPPKRLEVTSVVGIDRVGEGFEVQYSKLTLTGEVPGIAESAFKAAAEDAKKNCPISKLMQGNVDITLDVTFQG